MADGARRGRSTRTIYEDFDAQAPETTEFRRIFTRVMRGDREQKIRSVLFTSAEGGEGKTTSSSLFSIVASMHQRLKTCLVDADMHRPRVNRLFGTRRTGGLADVLAGELDVEECLRPTRFENLKLITAGRKRSAPSELLVPDALSSLMTRLRMLFDLIVIDSPPLLPVSDPVILAKEVDGVALVLRAGRTQRDVAQRAKRLLEDGGANLLGVVVNNVDDVLPYYYGHTYYRYPDGYDQTQVEGDITAIPPRDSQPEARPPHRLSRRGAASSHG